MSVLQSTEEGWILSHLDFINKIYEKVENKNESEEYYSLKFNKTLFNINSVFLRQNQLKNDSGGNLCVSKRKTRKRKKSNLLPDDFLNEIKYVKGTFEKLMKSQEVQNVFFKCVMADNNEAARLMSRKFYSDPLLLKGEVIEGSYSSEVSSVVLIEDEQYVFPKNCEFFCCDVRGLETGLPLKQFNFILMDPPWWNKSIRRKKEKCVEFSYEMMYNEELSKLPIGKLLSTKGLVAIWCTNSPINVHCILEEMFPAWSVKFQAKWYWIKVTQSGNVVCDFNETHGKQPYELLIIGTKDLNPEIEIPNGKVIVSVPSAMHSHKPPLTEIMAAYLPPKPKCLEIFARYLLPNWTSWGFEALKFQHISFFTRPDKNKEEENKETQNI